MKILFFGGHYAITAYLEYLVRAAKRKVFLDVRTAGPYMGVSMPYGSGIMVPQSYDFRPDYILPSNHDGNTGLFETPAGMLDMQLAKDDWYPDVLIEVNAGFCLSGMLKKEIPRVVVLTDPHVLRDNYNAIISRQHYDLIYNPQSPYTVNGERYLPYAADLEWNCPLKEEKEYDVTLIGNCYANRTNLFEIIKGRYNCFFRFGVAKYDANVIYNRSKVGLNWSSMDDLTARVFEIMGCGIVPVLNRVTDLPKLFKEGEEYLGFDDMNEGIKQIDSILADPEKCIKLGENARKAIVDGHHFYDDRMDTILKDLGELEHATA